MRDLEAPHTSTHPDLGLRMDQVPGYEPLGPQWSFLCIQNTRRRSLWRWEMDQKGNSSNLYWVVVANQKLSDLLNVPATS